MNPINTMHSDKEIIDEESALLSNSNNNNSSDESIVTSSSSRLSKVKIVVLALTMSVLAAVATYNYNGMSTFIYSARTDDDEYGDRDNEGSWSVNDDEAKKFDSKNVHGLSTTDFRVALKDSADGGDGVLSSVQQCLDWQKEYHITPEKHWGTFPQSKKSAWRAIDCDKKLEIHAQAMKFEAKHGKLHTSVGSTDRIETPSAPDVRSEYSLKSKVGSVDTPSRFNAVGADTVNSGFPAASNVPAISAANTMTKTSSAATTISSPLPQEREIRHDYALKATGLGKLEKQIEEDLQGENLKGLEVDSSSNLDVQRNKRADTLNEMELKVKPGSFEPPTFLCSLEPPSNGPDAASECSHKQMSFFVKGNGLGQWPAGFSYSIVQLTGIGPNHRKLVHSEVGDFKQSKDVSCDTFVRKLCLNGEYTLYAHNTGGKGNVDTAVASVETCDHSFSVNSGAALHFKSNAAAECLNTQFDPDSGHRFSLEAHKSFVKARQEKFAQFSVANADDEITKESEGDDDTVEKEEIRTEEDASADEAKPVKYSDSTMQRKEEELQAQDKKIGLTKDKIKLDSDRITLDQNQLGRYKQDIKAEEELLRVFRRKGEKQSSIIDKDQETLQKDEQNLQILFYQRGEIQKDIDNPYYKGDKDTDSNADTAEGSGDDDAAVIRSNSTDITGENDTSVNGTDADGMGIESNSTTTQGEVGSTENSTNPEGAPEIEGPEGQGESEDGSNSTIPMPGNGDGSNSTLPVGGGDGNNSTIPTPVIGGEGENSTNATSIPSDTEENCKPTIYNAYCSKTFKKVKQKVHGSDDGDDTKASGGLRGAWSAVEKGLGGKSISVKAVAPVAPVAQTPPPAPATPAVAPVHPATPAVAPVHPAASVVPPVHPAVAKPAIAKPAVAKPAVVKPAAPVHPSAPAAHIQPPVAPALADKTITPTTPKAVITEDKTVAEPAVHKDSTSGSIWDIF